MCAAVLQIVFDHFFDLFPSAFVAYLGFVNLLVAHSHPVMLMFCQLLINRDKHRGLEETLPQNQSVKKGSPEENGNATGMVLVYCSNYSVKNDRKSKSC